MECEHEEPYESVVFRNSQIVYPPDLAIPIAASKPTMTANSATSPVSTMKLMTNLTLAPAHESRRPPRQSVLQAFDPFLLSRKSTSSSPPVVSPLKNEELLSQIDFSSPGTSPPPLPKRNASVRLHQYDPVAIEDGKVQLNPSKEKLCPSSEDDDSEEFPNCPSIPQQSKTPNKVRGLISRVNSDFKNSFKRLSPAKTMDVTDSPQPTKLNTSHITGMGHAGMLGWNSSGNRREPPNLWTELKNGVLSGFTVQNGDAPVHIINVEKLISIGLSSSSVSLTRSSEDTSFSFDVITNKEKVRATLTAATLKERSKWMEWILESACGYRPTLPFCPELLRSFTRCGRVYIKDGVTSEWQTAWLLIQAEAKKLWVEKDGGSATSEDLRKIRSISKMKLTDGGGCPHALQGGPPFILHWTDHTFYIQSDLRSETDEWLTLSRTVSLASGADLEDHQLTADDVPVLVECCIKFIETYGMLTEGVYRRSGVQSKINRLLCSLKTDAWSVHISNEEFTEHDVANVLKRFFRTLPEPLLTNELYSQWMDGLADIEHDRQLELYKRLLNSLPHVNRQTLRKLLGHLHAVQNKCEKNLMSVSNLAALWGPNLMTVESARDHTSNFSHTNAETDVVLQLIQYYPWLFDVDREKLAVNDQISEVQERLEQGAFAKKSAGDIRTWIFSELIDQDVAVEIGPKVRVCDVLTNLEAPASQPTGAVLMESVCRGELRRPLHSKETLLPTILKWAEWSEEDRKNNQLVFARHPIIDQLLRLEKNLPPKSMFEVHYSSPKNKSFRQCPFEFCQARFTLLKDLKNHTLHGRWDLESIIWYLGGDSKRNPPTSWCITFIDRDIPMPKKGRQFFGHCLSFATESDYLTFIQSLILTEFEGGLTGFTAAPIVLRKKVATKSLKY